MGSQLTPADTEPEPDGHTDATGGDRNVVSRRRWLTAGGAVVAGMGVAAIAGKPAAAASGDPVLLGQLGDASGTGTDNITDDETRVWVDADIPRGLVFFISNPGIPNFTPLTGAVVGYTSKKYPGVRGVSVDWNGVIGESTSVVGVVGRSTADAGVLGESTNSIGVVGRGTSGAGVRGDSTTGNGVIGQSPNVVGVYGISTKDAGVLGTSTSSYGVVGRSTNLTGVQGTGPAYGVRGDSAKTGVWGNSTGPGGTYAGVEGTSTNNWGVHGSSSVASGVAGQSTSGAGVFGTGGTYGGEFKGSRSAIHLVPGATAGAPTSGQHAMGEMNCDSAGVLWFCSKAGTPGTWKKVKLVQP